MRTTTPTSDKELYRLVDAINGQEHAWPLYATPSRDTDGQCYLVELALPAETKAQWEFVSERLTPKAFDSDGNRWLIRPTVFEKMAFKCAGVTPGYYLKWGEKRTSEESPLVSDAPTSTAETKPEMKDSEAFIRYCCAEAGITDVPTMRLMFQIFCKCGLRWLLVNRKPLSLGFATIHALPFRKNWQAIAAAKWPHIGPTLKRRRLRMGILEATGVIPWLHSTDLMEVTDDNTVGWSLNVVEQWPFDASVNHMEKKTLADSEPHKYVARYGSIVKKSYEQIVECLAAYFQKTSRPVGEVDMSGARNNWSLRQKRNAKRVRPAIPKSPSVDPVARDFTATKEPVVAGEADAGEDENMPPVSDASGA